jgi:para-aminobenzoate synthetase component I
MTKNLLQWYWRSLPLNQRTGSEVFEALFLDQNSIATLLESPFPVTSDQPQLSRYSICAGSPRLQQEKPRLWTPKIGQILPFLRDLLTHQSNNQSTDYSHLPFTGGWLGWLGYDLAWEIETLPFIKPDPLPFPVAYWYEPENFAILDHQQQILWLASSNPINLDSLQQRLENYLPPDLSFFQENEPIPKFLFLTSQQDYQEAVTKAKQYIKMGDIFQANLSARFKAITLKDSWQIYRNLQTINPSPFASYWQTPWGVVISCSPERLVKLTQNEAETRPIAGTRPRGKDQITDQQLATELINNQKERAEHIMLVDLERNDLGRVCQWGTVKVDELFTIERYSHVMHLVSNIRGILPDNYNAIDLIKALFPGGTITGCPKVRCMEIIEELETFRRSLFYGSCGYLDQRGNLDLNIFIRTLLMTDHLSLSKTVWGQVGAGIVADSDPEREWFESLHKAEAQLNAIAFKQQFSF